MSSPYIPPSVIKKMYQKGISESQVLDVFNNGEYKTTSKGIPMAIKKYSGYDIGFFYSRNSNTGEYIITAVWKRPRL